MRRYVIRELAERDGLDSRRRRRLLARRQSRAEAGRRASRRRRCRRSRRCAPSRPSWSWPRASRALERRSNFIYQWNFVRNLKARMRRKARRYPGRFAVAPAGRHPDGARSSTSRTRRRISASPSAADYYHRAGALRVDRPHPGAGADHHRGGRSRSCPREPFRDPRLAGNPQHHGHRHASTAATAASLEPAQGRTTTAIGRNGWWWTSRVAAGRRTSRPASRAPEARSVLSSPGT